VVARAVVHGLVLCRGARREHQPQSQDCEGRDEDRAGGSAARCAHEITSLNESIGRNRVSQPPYGRREAIGKGAAVGARTLRRRSGSVHGVETWDAITSRRNVRAYADRPIERAHLDRILEAGRRAPSAKNVQRWDFVVVEDRDRLGELARLRPSARHVADSAVTIALVAPPLEAGRQRDLMQYDLGQVTMAMMIAAADLGIGSGHASVGDQDLARGLLAIPEDRFCAHLIAFGYPADRGLRPIGRPDRRPFDDVVHVGRW
jgi:nitroreductase